MESRAGSRSMTPPNRESPPFRCPYSPCDKTFFRREHLTRHGQSHSSVKPHKCHLCPKAFSRSDILKRHIALHKNPRVPKRTLIACDNCRRRKLKCDSDTPCATCLSSHLECERRREETPPPSRARPTVGRDISTDAAIADWSSSLMDLNMENFGSQGWYPSMGILSDVDLVGLSNEPGLAELPTMLDYAAFDFSRKAILTDTPPEPSSAQCSPFLSYSATSSINSATIHMNHQDGLSLRTPPPQQPVDPQLCTMNVAYHPSSVTKDTSIGINVDMDMDMDINEMSTQGSDMTSSSSPCPSQSSLLGVLPVEADQIPRLVSIYMSRFHPRWPIIYRRRFLIGKYSPELLGAMVTMASVIDGAENQDAISARVISKVTALLAQMPNCEEEITLAQLERLQAIIIYIVLLLVREGSDTLSVATISLVVNTLCSFRQRGIFNGGRPTSNTSNGPLESKRSVFDEELKRVGYSALRIDTYMSILTQQPPMLRYEEIGLALPVTERLWNATSADDFSELMWNEPTGRSKRTFRMLIRNAIESRGRSHRKLRLLESDLHLGLCAVYGRLWGVSQDFEDSVDTLVATSREESPSITSPSITDQKIEWIEHLDLWRQDTKNAALQEDSTPHEFQDADSGLDVLNVTLYHIARMDCHCTTPLLRHLGSRKGNSPYIARGNDATLEQWTQQQETRTMIIHAAQLLRICRYQAQSIPGRLINPLATAGLFRGGVLLCAYAANVKTCEHCAAPPPAESAETQQRQTPPTTAASAVDIMRGDAERLLLQDPAGSGWVAEGGAATLGQTPLCNCGLREIASIYTQCFQSSRTLLRRFQSVLRVLEWAG